MAKGIPLDFHAIQKDTFQQTGAELLDEVLVELDAKDFSKLSFLAEGVRKKWAGIGNAFLAHSQRANTQDVAHMYYILGVLYSKEKDLEKSANQMVKAGQHFSALGSTFIENARKSFESAAISFNIINKETLSFRSNVLNTQLFFINKNIDDVFFDTVVNQISYARGHALKSETLLLLIILGKAHVLKQNSLGAAMAFEGAAALASAKVTLPEELWVLDALRETCSPAGLSELAQTQRRILQKDLDMEGKQIKENSIKEAIALAQVQSDNWKPKLVDILIRFDGIDQGNAEGLANQIETGKLSSSQLKTRLSAKNLKRL